MTSKFKILILFSFLILIGCGAFENKEVEKIKNPDNNEIIYLINTSWGINDSRMAIGLDKKLRGGFSYEYPEKFVSVYGGTPILYKYENDTLHIYDGEFDRPKLDRFKTIIKFHKLNVMERLEIYKDYKKLGLKVFPESQTYIIENKDSDKNDKELNTTQK